MANTIVLPWCGCWIYDGTVNSRGHGVVSIYRGPVVRNAHLPAISKRKYLRQSEFVHRVMFQIVHNRLIETGKILRHLCHIASCWNPDHLVEGTQKENAEGY